ncbi:TetR family transcriptional regulator [Cupriavidus sp. UYMMa02A]|nr:TetR family transcriptional regulator [Cupriavidus sp. UYMMa02A]ODV43690.1 TetR family transcriptional regulator [Cupriavidus sp. UYMMa02A]
MRKRLLESAMIVFAQKGLGASVIPEVVAAAEVSKGSFYNYFRTNEELLVAVSEELSNEMLALIEGAVGGIEDPALRVATGVRSYLHLVRSYPIVARFLCSAGLSLAGKGSAMFDYLPPDLKEGQKRGFFSPMPIDAAVDLIAGTCLIAVYRMTNSRTAKRYPETLVEAMLRGLGIGTAMAHALTEAPIPKLTAPPESMLAKTEARTASANGDSA